jgi:hypothetical protein
MAHLMFICGAQVVVVVAVQKLVRCMLVVAAVAAVAHIVLEKF